MRNLSHRVEKFPTVFKNVFNFQKIKIIFNNNSIMPTLFHLKVKKLNCYLKSLSTK